MKKKKGILIRLKKINNLFQNPFPATIFDFSGVVNSILTTWSTFFVLDRSFSSLRRNSSGSKLMSDILGYSIFRIPSPTATDNFEPTSFKTGFKS